jgi:hypothetical protein
MSEPVKKWEYCVLRDYGENYDKKKGTTSDTTIVYTGNQVKSYKLSVKYDDYFPKSPWYGAIGLLGSAGWEMVTVVDDDITRFAYFKRPAIEGRAVDEPALTLPK